LKVSSTGSTIEIFSKTVEKNKKWLHERACLEDRWYSIFKDLPESEPRKAFQLTKAVRVKKGKGPSSLSKIGDVSK